MGVMPEGERRFVPGEQRRNNTQGRRVLTQVEVEETIMRLSAELDDLLEDLVDRASERAKAEHAYGLKKAKVNLTAGTRPGSGRGGNTTVDERESHVKIECEQEWLAHLVADAMYDVVKERIHAKRDQIRSLQTISANIRAMS